MRPKQTYPDCGADISDDAPSAVGRREGPRVEQWAVQLGPPLVEHRKRDYFGHPFGVVGVDVAAVPAVDDQ